MDKQEILNGLEQELRRGTVVLGALSQLDKPTYGYNLVARLAGAGLNVEANTLYPLLRRLESQGLLESQWDTAEAKPRKYYRTTLLGQEVYKELCAQWHNTVESMNILLEEEK